MSATRSAPTVRAHYAAALEDAREDVARAYDVLDQKAAIWEHLARTANPITMRGKGHIDGLREAAGELRTVLAARLGVHGPTTDFSTEDERKS